jgi:hypothetical protein
MVRRSVIDRLSHKFNLRHPSSFFFVTFVTISDANPKAKFDIALPAMLLHQLVQMAVI